LHWLVILKWMKVLAAVLLTLFAAGTATAGTSEKEKKDSPLAALAKKTEKKSSTKVIKADDLRKTKSRVTIPPATGNNQEAAEEGEAAPATEGGAEGEGAGEGEAEATPTDERAQQQSELQQQIDQQRELIQRLQAQNEEAQTQLNNQALAYPGNPRRAQLMERIEKNNEQIAAANQTIADLQTQARRAGVAAR
jgi:hypothetical protein